MCNFPLFEANSIMWMTVCLEKSRCAVFLWEIQDNVNAVAYGRCHRLKYTNF